MAKGALLLKILMDEVPRTVAELADLVGISSTYCFNLLTEMADDGAISLRKSAGTWIAWRHNTCIECIPPESTAKGQETVATGVNDIENDEKDEIT
nr:hypothetical protein [Candidatus Sigynarchaeota archaeon]